MAPEIHLKREYDGKSVDVFAAGIILFFMILGKKPFNAAKPSDLYYKLIVNNKHDLYWRTCEKNHPAKLSNEFKELFFAMTQLDGAKRPSLAEIL